MHMLKEENLSSEGYCQRSLIFLNSYSCSFTTTFFFCGQRLHQDKIITQKKKIITRQIKILIFKIIVGRQDSISKSTRKDLTWMLSYPKQRIQELPWACSKTVLCLTGYSQILNLGCDSAAVKIKQERKVPEVCLLLPVKHTVAIKNIAQFLSHFFLGSQDQLNKQFEVT